MGISVCIATYNGEKYIKEQLNSILTQLNSDDEVIISDDSSTDSTLDIVRGFKDERIKIYADNKFHSPVFNFENAILKAKGDYIFLSDQDDIWVNNKVSVMMEYLQKYDLVCSDCYVVDSELNIIRDSVKGLLPCKTGLIQNLIINSYSGSRMAFSRKILNYALPFPPKIAMHDIWIALIAEIFGKTYFIDQPLIKYRRHDETASTTGEKSTNSFLYKIKYRYYFMIKLILRYFSLK